MNNIYGAVSVPSNTPTIVAGITVPPRGGYSFKGAIIWCEIDCDVTVKFNLDTISGGRISGTTQTLFLDFGASPYGLGEGDMITISVLQTSGQTYTTHCTLLVEQL